MNRQDVFRRLLKTRWFTRFYGDVIGPASAKSFREPLRAELLNQLGPGARVLEVGCGPGLQAIDLAKLRPDLRITASDFSAEFVRLGESNAGWPGLRASFVPQSPSPSPMRWTCPASSPPRSTGRIR